MQAVDVSVCSLPSTSLHQDKAHFHGKSKFKRYSQEYLQELENISLCLVRDHLSRPSEESLKSKAGAWYAESNAAHGSLTPVASIQSGQSSPHDTVDSGVSSEHDTPPPKSKLERGNARASALSDSDNDSSISSEDVPLKDAAPQKSSRNKLFQPTVGSKTHLPEALLREICEKYEAMQRRKRAASQEKSEKLERSCVVRPSKQSKGRVTFGASCPEGIFCSTFSTCLSLLVEEEPPASPVPKSLGPPNSEDRNSLFECRDKAAGEGFAGLRDIFSPQQESTIRSNNGTVRGVKNRVRAGIATFTNDQRMLRHYADLEKGRVVVYLTTLGIVRETYEKCLRVRKILWTLQVQFEERDVFMSRETQLQVMDRLHSMAVSVPHVFLEGQYLGGTDQIERMNENGELRKLLHNYRRPVITTKCDTCGGFRLLPCPICNGSKKSVHRNDFTLEFIALKCSACDESGLVRCKECPLQP